jgi:hypothetical protein
MFPAYAASRSGKKTFFPGTTVNEHTRRNKSMKSWLLPLTTTLGAVSAVTLMFATQVAPASEKSAEAERQIQRMEHQSRLREWSQGLGIALPEGAVVARAQTDSSPASDDRKASDRARTCATDGEKRHEREDENGRDRNNGHEEGDEAAS